VTMAADSFPLFPPFWFVERFNTRPERRGKPYLIGTDPLLMLLWHQSQAAHDSRTSMVLISGT